MQKRLKFGVQVAVLVGLALACIVAIILIFTFTLKREEHVHRMIYVEGTAASCVEEGEQAHWACLDCGRNFLDFEGKEILVDIVLPSLGHLLDDYVQVIEPTCTKEGKEAANCLRCGMMVERVLAVTEHIPGEAVCENEEAASCTDFGKYDLVVYCTVCNAELSRKTEETAPFGHDPGEAVCENEEIFSCVEPRKYDLVVYCTICNAELNRKTIETGEPIGHNWGSGIVMQESTCTQEGLRVYTCARCGESKTEVIAKADHKLGNVLRANMKEATCMEAGSYELIEYCGVCKSEIGRTKHTVSPLGHVLDVERIEWMWNGTASATAAVPCMRGHTEYFVAKVSTSVLEGGMIRYTATVVIDGVLYSTTLEKNASAPSLEFVLNSDKKSYSVAGIGMESGTDIEIPSSHEGLPVTAIGAQAFKDCHEIVTIVIPNSVVYIGDKAFSNCESLLEITFSCGVGTGTDVFRGSINVTIIFRHTLTYVPEYVPTCEEIGHIEHYFCEQCGKNFSDAAGEDRLYNVEYTVEHSFVGGICTNCGAISANLKIVAIDDSIGFLGKFALGTLENAIGLPESILVTTEDGIQHALPVEWDLSEYKKDRVGYYVIKGYIQVGNYYLSGGLSNLVDASVEIVDYMYGTADIVFVIDRTGSMADDITEVKNNVNAFAMALEELGVSARWALVTYQDITSDGINSTDIVYNGSSGWFINASEYRDAISDIRVAGGGDTAETAIDGLMKATTLETRKDARTFYILVTDAPSKINNTFGVESMADLVEALANKNVCTSVVTPMENQSGYRVLTQGTGGVMTNMTNFDDTLFDYLVPLIFDKVID